MCLWALGLWVFAVSDTARLYCFMKGIGAYCVSGSVLYGLSGCVPSNDIHKTFVWLIGFSVWDGLIFWLEWELWEWEWVLRLRKSPGGSCERFFSRLIRHCLVWVVRLSRVAAFRLGGWIWLRWFCVLRGFCRYMALGQWPHGYVTDGTVRKCWIILWRLFVLLGLSLNYLWPLSSRGVSYLLL